MVEGDGACGGCCRGGGRQHICGNSGVVLLSDALDADLWGMGHTEICGKQCSCELSCSYASYW